MALRVASVALLGVGIGLFVWLILEEGVGEVYAATAAAGWGVLAVVAFHLLPMLADTAAWRLNMPPEHRPAFRRVLWVRWMSVSVNNLLPAAPVSGDLVRTRLAILIGVPPSVAGATVIADLTLGALSQCLFCVFGILALLAVGTDAGHAVVTGSTIGVVVFAGLIGVFLALQRAGMFNFLARLAARLAQGRDWLALVGGASALDRDLAAVYARRRTLAHSMVWRMVSWVLGTGEVWLALHFLGHPVGLLEAFMLESLIQAIRGAAFAIPGALGVQEGGLILLGALVGLGVDESLALSLIKRARELAVGVPGLIGWQVVESRRLALRVRGAAAAAPPLGEGRP
jgi:putative membrane protein